LESGTGQIGVPLVQVIELHEAPEKPCLDDGFLLPPWRMPALIVSLNAADEFILEAVRCELEKRKHSTAPVRKPGRRSLSRKFGPKTFEQTVWDMLQLTLRPEHEA
jgi:hypothetical protein